MNQLLHSAECSLLLARIRIPIFINDFSWTAILICAGGGIFVAVVFFVVKHVLNKNAIERAEGYLGRGNLRSAFAEYVKLLKRNVGYCDVVKDAITGLRKVYRRAGGGLAPTLKRLTKLNNNIEAKQQAKSKTIGRKADRIEDEIDELQAIFHSLIDELQPPGRRQSSYEDDYDDAQDYDDYDEYQSDGYDEVEEYDEYESYGEEPRGRGRRPPSHGDRDRTERRGSRRRPPQRNGNAALYWGLGGGGAFLLLIVVIVIFAGGDEEPAGNGIAQNQTQGGADSIDLDDFSADQAAQARHAARRAADPAQQANPVEQNHPVNPVGQGGIANNDANAAPAGARFQLKEKLPKLSDSARGIFVAPDQQTIVGLGVRSFGLWKRSGDGWRYSSHPLEGGVTKAAISGDSSRVLFVSLINIEVWDLKAERLLCDKQGTKFAIGGSLSADGKLAATQHTSNQIDIWNTDTGAVIDTLESGRGSIGAVSFQDAQLVSSRGSTIRLWSDRKLTEEINIATDKTRQWFKVFLPRTGSTALLHWVSQAAIVDITKPESGPQPLSNMRVSEVLALHPSGRFALVRLVSDLVVLDLNTQPVIEIPIGDKYVSVNGAAFIDDTRIITIDYTGEPTIWQLDNGSDSR